MKIWTYVSTLCNHVKIEHRQPTRIQETDHVISSQISSNETHALNKKISSLVMIKRIKCFENLMSTLKCSWILANVLSINFRTYLTQQKISVDDREVFGKLLLNLINSATYSRHHYVSLYVTSNLWREKWDISI